MSGSENDVVFARLKSLQDTVKSLRPGKSDATVVAVVQEVLGFLIACSTQEVIVVAIKVLEDGIVLSPQAGTILRLEGGLKQVIKHLRAATTLPSIAGPCARILAVAAATSTVTQQALAKEKGLGLLLLNTCAVHVRDPGIAGPLSEAMAHIARAPKGAVQLECDGLLPVMQEMLVSYLGNWPVFGWVLKLMKNLAKYEHLQYGGGPYSNGSGSLGSSVITPTRGGNGILTVNGDGVRLLLGVARVLARIPEQRKLLKRVSRTLWLLCPHVLVALPPLEPLVPLPSKDAPHLTVASAAETDPQRHQELFPEEYPWQQPQQQQQQQATPQAGIWPGLQPPPSIMVRPAGALPVRPPSARQTCRSLAASGGLGGGPADMGGVVPHGLGQMPEPFHGYGTSLDCEMMLHDLQRIANPRAVVNRIVYMNTNASGGSAGAGGVCLSPPYSIREAQQQPPPPARAVQQTPASDQGTWWNESNTRGLEARAASGNFPDVARLAISDAAPTENTSGAPSPAAATRAASSPELDPFHLPLINNGDSWSRADVSANPPPAQRSSGRFSTGPQGVSTGSGLGGGGGRPPSPPSSSLSFHSCFESGNLRCAAQVGPREYDLFLAADLNDRSEGGNLCQWFYFAVTVPAAACSGVGWPQHGAPGRGAGGGGGGGGLPHHHPQQQGDLQAALEAAAAASASGGASGTGLAQGPGIKINLVNLRKKESLFSGGKRPVMCLARPADGEPLLTPRSRPASAPSPATDPGVWFRGGTHISYYPSPYRGRPTVAGEGAASRKGKKPSVAAAASGAAAAGAAAGGAGGGVVGGAAPAPKKTKGKGKASAGDGGDGEGASGSGLSAIGPGLYCATFTLHFPVPGVYYVASCYPYTYSDLQDYLEGLQRRLTSDPSSSSPSPSRPQQSPLLQQLPSAAPLVRSLLCYTLSGLRVDLLTITDWGSPLEAVRQRECIFITARVHPGETCASWLMQGMLEFLCSSDPAAVTLRSSFVFKLVPMLNPDGVVNGNYRCSLAGVDLNRVWDRPVRCLYPTVYHSKRVLQQLAAAGRLALYIDIHGHSTKSDTFFYGCEPTPAALQAHAGGNKDARVAPGTGASYSYPNPRDSRGFGLSAASAADADGQTQLLAPQQQQSLQGCNSPGAGGPSGSVAGGAGGSPSILSVQGNGFNGGVGGACGNVGVYGGGGGMYGGGPPQQSGPASSAAPQAAGPSARVAARLRVRMLPYLTARISSDFSYPKCSFKIRKAKLSAARVVVHRELGVAGSYTLEASLAGSSSSAAHFNARDYLAMGHNLCRAICELAEVDDAALLEEMNARVTLPPM